MMLTRGMAITVAIVTVGGLLMGSAHAEAVDGSPLTFTAAQAARGKALYDASCSACHGAELAGGGGAQMLKGGAFRAHWVPQPGDALYRYIRENMPSGAQGSLTGPQYADILAYILQGNGAKPGDKELPPDATVLAALNLEKTLPPPPPGEKEAAAPQFRLEPDAIARAAVDARTQRIADLRPVTDEMLRHPPQGSWLHWRRTYDAQGFSPLAQINTDNANKLQLAWAWRLQNSANEITPLVHDGVMFVASGGRVEALDAETGDRFWQYFKEGAPGHIRNLAIYGDRIFMASSDAHLTALNMHTGAVVWDQAFARPEDHLRFTGGPLIAKGKIMQGMSGCHRAFPGGCFILAVDPDTGKELWRFNTLARPGQPGGNSWAGEAVNERVGGSVWTTGSYDPDLDLVYFGVGQSYKVTKLLESRDKTPHSSDALYTDSTLALRPDSGKLVWFYQHMARDVWDLDWAFEQMLITRSVDGKPRKTVTTGGKMAIFDTLDATNGRYVQSYDAGLQTLVTSIDPRTGVKTIDPALTPQPEATQVICPSTLGDRNWPSTSYNPESGTLYIPLSHDCMPYKWSPSIHGDMDLLMAPVVIYPPDFDGNVGEVQAVDLATGKKLWTRKQRAPESSAILATAGGIIFEGSRDRWFRASDAKTGELLWKVRLDDVASSYPITYSINGVQYVAVTTGGGNSNDSMNGMLAPELTLPVRGVTLWVFRLQ
jgi:alcohol dehydrogenase (cytochrome c)